jgi:hypothetical protein
MAEAVQRALFAGKRIERKRFVHCPKRRGIEFPVRRIVRCSDERVDVPEHVARGIERA